MSVDHGSNDTDNAPNYAVDEQTGKRFKIAPEGPLATAAAIVAMVYLLVALGVLLWMLFDTWAGRNLVLDALGYDHKVLVSPTFRLMAYVAIGGSMGGAVDGIRSVVSWHSERGAYGARFLWKDLSLPLSGAAVGLFVYATVRGGAGILSGDFSLSKGGGAPALAAFAVSALAGFSSQQVFRWLDAQANRMFKVTRGRSTMTPDLTGKTLAEVRAALKACKLKLGSVAQTPAPAHVGKVVRQSPAAGAAVVTGEAVDVTLGA